MFTHGASDGYVSETETSFAQLSATRSAVFSLSFAYVLWM
jgi:hypothetical protein